MLGCLPAARHTLNKTLFTQLLSKPNQSGVTLLPQAKVLFIRQIAGGYQVTYEDRFNDRGKQSATAAMVFLAAGVLGSTEILWRSFKKGGLPLNDQVLGTKFSTNGDFGAFAYRTTKKDGTPLPVYSTRGPINTSHVQFNFQGKFIKIEDCAIPAMFAEFVSKGLEVLDNLGGSGSFFAFIKSLWESNLTEHIFDVPDTNDSKKFQTEAEMMSNIFFFNVMGQDDASGRIELGGLDGDQIEVNWKKPVAEQPIWKAIESLLREFSTAMGGHYITLPTWQGLLGPKKLVVTHPLGGCPIGATHDDGVVNEFGQVFDASKPAASKQILDGLYVVDGAVIPGALAANPSFTITAQAFKAVKKALP